MSYISDEVEGNITTSLINDLRAVARELDENPSCAGISIVQPSTGEKRDLPLVLMEMSRDIKARSLSWPDDVEVNWSWNRNDLHGANIYLSGPMTGVDGLNAEAFNDAERIVRGYGADYIYNPVTHTNSVHEDGTEATREEFLLYDLHVLTGTSEHRPRINVVVQVDSWEKSRGAIIEYRVARACGIRCIELGTLVRNGGHLS